jgi:hypothetical protein
VTIILVISFQTSSEEAHGDLYNAIWRNVQSLLLFILIEKRIFTNKAGVGYFGRATPAQNTPHLLSFRGSTEKIYN